MSEKLITVKQIHGEPVQYVFSKDDASGHIQISNKEEPQKILSIIPSKIVTSECFQEQYMKTNSDQFHYQEFVEGTFICVFYDERICGWEMATKNSVGCNYWYIRNQYKAGDFDRQLTFRQMLIECLGGAFDQDFNELPFLNGLSKTHVYHFVIQHPTNKMILNVQIPNAYLVDVYEINGARVQHIPIREYKKVEGLEPLTRLILYPSTYTLEKLDDLTVDAFFKEHELQGLVATHLTSGTRTIFEDREYRKIKELRGNHPNLQYLYLSLIKENKITEFLNVFSVYKKLFELFRQELHDFVCQLHSNYISYYVQKSGAIIPKKYFPLVYKLHHEVFLVNKRDDSTFILRRGSVYPFIKKLDVGTVLFYLNIT